VGDRCGDQVGIADWGKIDEVASIRKVAEQLGRDLESQAGLAGAAGAAQCDQAHVGPSEQRCRRGDLVLATDQRGWLRRQVGAMSIECLERREAGWQVGGDQLKNLLGQAEIFEAMDSQVAQRHLRRELLAHQLFGGQREQDLAAMAGRQEPRDSI
jgi:hypothetical protein